MKRLIKFLLSIGAALCLLTACGGDEGPLEVYTLGEGEGSPTVVALDTILAEGEAVLTSIDAPTDVAVQAGLQLSHTYHYRQMEDPAALAARYIGLLRGEQGFTPIDKENRQLAEEPDLETLSGELILGKKMETSDDTRKIYRVIVGWSEYAVAVQVAQADGRILPPPEPEKEAAEAAPQPTSMMEQLEFFKGLDPEKLGMVGNDMNDYMVYPQQGWVLVDGISCREIMVYLADAKRGDNVYMGTFFLSSDNRNMYKKTDSGIVALADFN